MDFGRNKHLERAPHGTSALIWLLLLAMALGLTPNALASISITQSVDRAEMPFEDTASFQITVSWDGPLHAYIFEKPIRLAPEQLKVARFSSKVQSTGSGENEVTTKTFDYKLVPVLSGNATVPSVSVEYLAWPDSLPGLLITDPVSILVHTPLPVTQDGEKKFSVAWLVLILVVLFGVGVGLYAVFKPKPEKEVTLSPAGAFLQGLTRVKAEAGSDLKLFQTGLYRLLTEYIETNYKIQVVNRPADTVVDELEKCEPVPNVRETIGNWLTRAEREKFTPLASAPGEVMRLESEVRTFFEKMS